MSRWLVICHLFSELFRDLPFIFTSFCHTEELKTCLKKYKSWDSYCSPLTLAAEKSIEGLVMK